jgi:FkbM family methyltransferase
MKKLKNLLISNYGLMFVLLKIYCKFYGISLLNVPSSKVSISKQKRTIYISKNHLVYLIDIIPFFDFYFNAVKASSNSDEESFVDYSGPKLQSVVGYNLDKLWVPSLPEPIETSNSYIKLSNPASGMTIIDLGSYCALTAITFKNVVGQSGIVVSVEADPVNFECSSKNLESFEEHSGMDVKLLQAAVWNSDGSTEFLAEFGLGSAISEVLPRARGLKTLTVPTMTLSSIANHYQLERVDIVKADIEGAELEVFSDAEFFSKYKPKIVFEGGGKSLRKIEALLISYGYKCERHFQVGARLPLVMCEPQFPKTH